MKFDNLASSRGLFLGIEHLYSCDGENFFISNKIGDNKEKVDIGETNLNDIVFKYKKELIVYLKNNLIKVFYLPTKKIILEQTLTDQVSSFCISPSGMNIAIGFSNGKTVVLNNLLGDRLGKFTLFSDGSEVKHIDFLDDEVMIGATNDKIMFISFLKKGAVAKVSSDIQISNIYTTQHHLIYTTIDNEIYLLDLENLKHPKKSMLAKINFDIVDIKFSKNKSIIYVATKDKIFTIDKNDNKVVLLQDGFDDISNISIDETGSLYIGMQTSSEFLEIVDEDKEIESKAEIQKSKVEEPVRFLTVDDSTTIRLVIKRSILNNFDNVEVGEAVDGVDALKYLTDHPNTDILFLDWNMPNMNGDIVVEEIAKREELKHIKIIMATTEGGKDRVKQMISKGVIGYLVKPLKAGSVNPLAQKMIEMVKKERIDNV